LVITCLDFHRENDRCASANDSAGSSARHANSEMPSRAAVIIKVVFCTSTKSPSRAVGPQSESCNIKTQPRGFQVATQQTLLSPTPPNRRVSASSLLYHIPRHYHHHQLHSSTQMDATLGKLFLSNSQWAAAVDSAEPDFFEQSAQGQSPKVRPFFSCHAAFLPIFIFPSADPLARMLRLARPRERHHGVPTRRYLCSP